MADIIATEPVVAPAVGSITYDKWFMTQLVANINPTSCKANVHLRRANINGGTTTLMAGNTESAEVAFTVDVFKEMAGTPELAAAIEAIKTAVIAYATKKNLL